MIFQYYHSFLVQSVDACKQRCKDQSGCDCIQMWHGKCYLRKQCVIRKCQNSGRHGQAYIYAKPAGTKRPYFIPLYLTLYLGTVCTRGPHFVTVGPWRHPGVHALVHESIPLLRTGPQAAPCPQRFGFYEIMQHISLCFRNLKE